MKDLHAEILALPCTPGKLHESMHRAYEFGHRDARHAAAELVVAVAEREPAAEVIESRPYLPNGETFKAALLLDNSLPSGTKLYTAPQAQPAADLTNDEAWHIAQLAYQESRAQAIKAELQILMTPSELVRFAVLVAQRGKS